jgi:hypothetical protein
MKSTLACGRSTKPSPPPAPERGDAVNRLPDGTRRRLQGFAGRLERIQLEELPMYVVRPIEPGHGEAIERAETAAEERGLGGAVGEARTAMIEFVERRFTDAQYRPTIGGLNWGIGLGPTEDRVRVARSLGDAVGAVVLWDALDDPDRAELLGPWANLVD